MKKNIFVALDFDSLDLALETTKKIKDEIAGVKVGTELYTVCGNEGLSKIKKLGVDIFLDLKLGPEIPNQVKKTVIALNKLNAIKYLTIHTSGDYEMLKAAQEAEEERIRKEEEEADFCVFECNCCWGVSDSCSSETSCDGGMTFNELCLTSSPVSFVTGKFTIETILVAL